MAFLIARWRLVAEAVVIGILLIVISVVTIQRNHYKADRDAIEAQFGAFKDQVSRLGKEAEAKAKQREADDAARIKRAFDDRNLALKRLSDERTRRSQLPSAPIVAEGTGNLCKLTPADFERAYSQLARDLSGIAQEGDDSIVDGHALLKSR